MPNTLAHLGAQVLVSRALLPASALHWIALGCVIPDLPWILQRAVRIAIPGADLFAMRFYAIAQASLLASLLACAAFACLARQPRRVFGLLVLNAVAHLVLDALQTKWANGVHLFAPFSWTLWNAGWFWPESLSTLLLSVAGVLAVAVVWRAPAPEPFRPGARRCSLALVFGVAYLAFPYAFSAGPERADNHFAATLRDVARRPGRLVAFDRVPVFRRDGRDHLVTLMGEALPVAGIAFDAERVSVKGRFVDENTLAVDEWRAHHPYARETLTYVGLGVVIATWLRVAGIGTLRARGNSRTPARALD